MALQAVIPALKLTGKPQCQIIPLAAEAIGQLRATLQRLARSG